MKICHALSFHPGRSGLYEQGREQIAAERRLGLDSYFYNVEQSAGLGKKYLYDRDVKSKGIEWLNESDIVVIHQMLPDEIYRSIKKPIVLMAHGTPADCFWGEHFQNATSYSLMVKLAKNPKLTFVTMWQRHRVFWEHICENKVFLVDPGIEVDRYKVDGKVHEYTDATRGYPNIMWADTWRIFKLPFETLHGFKLFKERVPKARLHLYACPMGGKEWPLWKGFFDTVSEESKQFFGEMEPLIPTDVLETKYRAADILVTPQKDATRCIRECQAVGTPVVAGLGFEYSPYTADFSYPEDICSALLVAWDDIQNDRTKVRQDTRCIAEAKYDINRTAKQMKEIYQKLI